MKRMDSMLKAKLPRKRKKRAIKAQGRNWYHGTVILHKLSPEGKVCKFWKNDSISEVPVIINGYPVKMRLATKYW